jgi:hypothetical protein
MAQTIILTGAYGRTYSDKESVTKAWESGKDFKILHGPYCSIRDIDTLRRLHEVIFIHYGDGEVIRI